jgi:hypothetical protein
MHANCNWSESIMFCIIMQVTVVQKVYFLLEHCGHSCVCNVSILVAKSSAGNKQEWTILCLCKIHKCKCLCALSSSWKCGDPDGLRNDLHSCFEVSTISPQVQNIRQTNASNKLYVILIYCIVFVLYIKCIHNCNFFIISTSILMARNLQLLLLHIHVRCINAAMNDSRILSKKGKDYLISYQ